MKLLKEVGLFIVGSIVFWLWGLIGMFYTLIKHVRKGDYSVNKHLAPIIRASNLANDGKANAKAGEMMNDLFLTEKNIKLKYGSWDETISLKTGQNLMVGNLNKKGIKFQKFVDSILGENHCKETVENYKIKIWVSRKQ